MKDILVTLEVSFQSTPPRGCDPLGLLYFYRINHFNPRPRAGGDPRLRCSYGRDGNFNPRPREGGDRIA